MRFNQKNTAVVLDMNGGSEKIVVGRINTSEYQKTLTASEKFPIRGDELKQLFTSGKAWWCKDTNGGGEPTILKI